MKYLILPDKKHLRDLRDLVISEDAKSLPIDLCYLILKNDNFEYLPDTIKILPKEQVNGLVSFHCWRKDEIIVDAYFELISVASVDQTALKKLLISTEPNFITYFLLENINFKILEEKVEFFDEENAFTIDGGFTWLWITTPDPTKEILIRNCLDNLMGPNNILLNLIINFGCYTKSYLQEEAYQEREKLLSKYGFPDQELRREILEGKLVAGNYSEIGGELIHEDGTFHPLNQIVEKISKEDLSPMIRNIVYAIGLDFNLDITELENLYELEEFVFATINLGVQKLILKGKTLEDFYDPCELKDAFKVGWFDILYFYKKFKNFSLDSLSQEIAYTIASIQKFPPKLPKYFTALGLISKDNTKFDSSLVPISNLSQLTALKQLLLDLKRF